jgi:ParB family chromosome partitioning protein
VRREALTEVTAQDKEAWAAPLLYEFFNDPDPGLRKEAFEFATKKNKDLAVLETALQSRFPDARKLAVEGLVKKHAKAAQQVLLRAVSDPDQGVRLAAVTALVDDDAKALLRMALQNERADVRVRAAAALARHADPVALPVLRSLATAPEPDHKERMSDWLIVAVVALGGLAEFGAPEAQADAVGLLDSPHPRLRAAAAHALVWAAKADTASALRAALQHSDGAVKYRAALGLAYLGDAAVAPLVRSADAGAVLTAAEQFTATVALGAAAGVQGTVYLDSPDEKLRDRALLATLLLELKDTDGQPEKCIECLSAKGARFRLTGAQALERFADHAAFREFVTKEVNDRGDDTPWKVSAEVIEDLANLLAFADPQLKAKTALLLALFDNKEQAEWNAAWAVHAARFANEIKAAREAAAEGRRAGQVEADARAVARAGVRRVRRAGARAGSERRGLADREGAADRAGAHLRDRVEGRGVRAGRAAGAGAGDGRPERGGADAGVRPPPRARDGQGPARRRSPRSGVHRPRRARAGTAHRRHVSRRRARRFSSA